MANNLTFFSSRIKKVQRWVEFHVKYTLSNLILRESICCVSNVACVADRQNPQYTGDFVTHLAATQASQMRSKRFSANNFDRTSELK